MKPIAHPNLADVAMLIGAVMLTLGLAWGVVLLMATV